MPAVIDIEGICFAYSGQEVLHNVNFQVGERDMVAIVGPNGGGKTTLLKIVLGLLTPRFGAVHVFGQAPKAARRRIGYVPQHIHFDSQFPVNVLDVVRMGRVERHTAGPYRKPDTDAAMAALERVQMAEFRHRAFSQLSGGERQRVLVAQALVSEPELLLMDEPTANVDAAVEHRLYALFGKLNERLTIVFVSHNLAVVTRHVSHVLCVNRTAELHSIGEISSSVFQSAQGGDMAVLLHDISCQVTDSSGVVLHTPHNAEPEEVEPSSW